MYDTLRLSPSVRFADRITPREGQVLDLVTLGKSNASIAIELGIALGTVEVHRLHLMRKLQADGLCELLWLALTGDYPPKKWSDYYFG